MVYKIHNVDVISFLISATPEARASTFVAMRSAKPCAKEGKYTQTGERNRVNQAAELHQVTSWRTI